MDRNPTIIRMGEAMNVALRKESVDRNSFVLRLAPSQLVALRKESVDRNDSIRFIRASAVSSLSARRAWIEIQCPDL